MLIANHRDEHTISGKHGFVVLRDAAKRRAAHNAQVSIAASIMAEAQAVADLVQHDRLPLAFVQSGPSRLVNPDQTFARLVDVALSGEAHVVLEELNADRDGCAPKSERQCNENSHASEHSAWCQGGSR